MKLLQSARTKAWYWITLLIACLAWPDIGLAQGPPQAPAPLSEDGRPVDWLFVFKLNAGVFPSAETPDQRDCIFGGTPKPYPKFSQQYALGTSEVPQLHQGTGLVGAGNDALGATFAEIYNGQFHYVVWNDQFYSHPAIAGCSDSCSSPWGHSKGVLAWNDAGEGILLQVTTPSWPAAASAAHPREGDGNTLGCITDNDVKVSQDFFALRLTEHDVETVLDGLANASVVTDITNLELVSNGGPMAIQQRVLSLGTKSTSTKPSDIILSTGVRLISKPSALHVPPWQMVSALLGGVDLRTATWWTNPAIPSTTATTPIACWESGLPKPGGVEIATSGHWAGQAIGLKGGPAADGNHAKIGISLTGPANFTILGDMNQQGALAGNCASSQNGRGGLFLLVDNAAFKQSIGDLISGDTAPTAPEN